MDLTETVLDSERIYDGRVVALRRDTVRLPNGETSAREVIEHGGAVAIVPLTENNEVVLINQFRLPAGKVLLEIPAGGIEPGESPEDAAARELAEEIGMRPAKLTRLFSMFLAPGYSTELIHVFVAEGLNAADAHADADEFVQIVTMPLADALEKLDRGEFDDAKTIAGIAAAARRIRS